MTSQLSGFGSVQLSLMHPRLLHTLVLLDPVIQRSIHQVDVVSSQPDRCVVPRVTQLSTHRRDWWPSRQAAADDFRRNPFYQAWDSRVFDRWVQYGLRDLPTAIYPLCENTGVYNKKSPVTLRTSRHQEVFTYSRPNYDYKPGSNEIINRATHPDLDTTQPDCYPFYRPEPSMIFARLPQLRPSVLYVFAGNSEMCLPPMRDDKMANTGTGLGGSGGVAAGRVKGTILENTGHLLPLEIPKNCAYMVVCWLATELQRWCEEKEIFHSYWCNKSSTEKMSIDKEWLKFVPEPRRLLSKAERNRVDTKL